MAARTSGAVTRIINDYERGRFEYGVNDCCQFSAFVVRRLTGRNLLARVDYQGETAAEAYIAEQGGLEAAVTGQVGHDPVSLEELRPGDLVLWSMRGRDGIGVAIRHGAMTFATVTEGGDLVLLPRGFARLGWRV